MENVNNVLLVEETNTDEKHELGSILCSQKRDFLVSNNGEQVKVTSLTGKIVGLYFSRSSCGYCEEFTPVLVEVYNELKLNGNFEIVFLSADEDDNSFNDNFSKMPWLAIPFTDSEARNKLDELFRVDGFPHLVIVDENGKVLTDEGVDIVKECGVEGYPFDPEHIEKLKELEEEAMKNQSLKSLLVSQTRDYVIASDGAKIPVSSLVGKHVALYFSAHYSSPCHTFLPKLIQAYKEFNEKNNNSLEVIFLSRDRDQSSFDEFFATMPWLALPFGDDREKSLSSLFKVKRIPMVVTICPTGKTLATEARELIMHHGAKAYPFTSERVKEIEGEIEKMAESWPKKITNKGHVHELELTYDMLYDCNGCKEEGQDWSYNCEECDYYLHPECALGDDYDVKVETKDDDEGEEKKAAGEGLTCDGGCCFKK